MFSFFNTGSSLPVSTRRHQDGIPTPAAYTTTASASRNRTTSGPGIFFSPILFFSFSIINIFFLFIRFNPAITRRHQDGTPTLTPLPPPQVCQDDNDNLGPNVRTMATSHLRSRNWALVYIFFWFIYLFYKLTNCLLHFRHYQLLYHCEPPHQGQVIFFPHVLSLFLFFSTNLICFYFIRF